MKGGSGTGVVRSLMQMIWDAHALERGLIWPMSGLDYVLESGEDMGILGRDLCLACADIG